MDDQKPPPKGRGALIVAALAKMKEMKAAEAAGTTEPEPPKPRGRAALLLQLKKKQISIVGGGDSAPSEPEPFTPKPELTIQPDISNVTEKLDEIKIEKKICEYKGESGTVVPASANYMQLVLDPGRGVFEYEVKFTPKIDSKSARFKMLNGVLSTICKAKTFDGALLYLPEKIIDTQKTFNVTHPYTNEPVSMTLIYKKQKNMAECLHLYNVLFRRIMFILKYKEVKRHFFDNRDPFKIPQHKLEIWPGYVVSVNEYTGGIMLCLDVQHKVLRTQNALEAMYEVIEQNPDRYKNLIEKEFLGAVVLTRYNNKTYVIHDVMWDASPKSKFETSDGESISFIDYYRNQYNLEICDVEQPMLVHRQTIARPDKVEKEDRTILLVPELSYMTGLKEEMRNDFRVMKEVAEFTRVTPNQRMNALRKFIDSVNKTEEARDVLSVWGLRLANATIDLQMRILSPEDILFGKGAKEHGSAQADWTSAAMRNPVMCAVDLRNWVILCTGQDKRQADEFVQTMLQCAKKMGIQINRPRMVPIPDDRNETYMRILQETITPDLQIVCIICPTSRDDRYMTIKKICCHKKPIPSQVINSRTLKNPKRLSAITQKIALQINCKLGGSLWSVRFPFKKWLICGIDVYHSTTLSGQAVGALVSSLDEAVTNWFSRVCFHNQDKEISDHLKILFMNALQQYNNANGYYPEKVVVFRDGLGDGQLDTCRKIEVQQLLSVFKDLNIPTKLIFIIVQKRISTRIFMTEPRKQQCENPPAGSIVDDGVTRKYLYDFFLVSQHVRQGTVTPTHYVVLYDDTSVKPDHIQRLTYKMCHMYYNWTGTIRVPAPCQYAHKLAFLIGQCVRSEHSPLLEKKLFYL